MAGGSSRRDEEDTSKRKRQHSSSRDRRRRDDRYGDDESASDVNSEASSDRRDRKKHSKKKKHKKRHKEDRRKHHKKESKHRKRDRYDSDSASTRSRSDSEERHRKRKRKKEKRSRKEASREAKQERTDPVEQEADSRNHVLTQALVRLFSLRPLFAEELPIMLIRLAGGSTFDLRQMDDGIASQSLQGLLECLEVYGVKHKDGEWMFEAPPGRRDERVLLRVIRAVLNDVGVTMEAVAQHEATLAKKAASPTNDSGVTAKSDVTNGQEEKDLVIDNIKQMTSDLVLKFTEKDTELGSQLAGLCQTIAQGESISIDGLPDENLKTSLEAIFVACGLEKSELVEDDDSDDGDQEDDSDDDGPLMGFGLPEGSNDTIAAVMEACRNPKRRVMGPAMPTAQDKALAAQVANLSDEEDEGPQLVSDLRNRRRGPMLPAHVIKAQAEYRALELKATAAGVEIPADGGGREEWMVVPGKYDFLSNIKSGQPIKSRGFQNKKTRGGDAAPKAIHPAIQAEMDAIMQAHQDARGQSLMEEHRAKKLQEKKEASGKKAEWKWSRDKDLDAGRRVDKDALHMVLGGAADNLKTKFQGGFN